MDKIDKIVDKSIVYTEDILSRGPHLRGIAREGLERMRENLKIGAEDHPALRRLEDYLDELGRRMPNESAGQRSMTPRMSLHGTPATAF